MVGCLCLWSEGRLKKVQRVEKSIINRNWAIKYSQPTISFILAVSSKYIQSIRLHANSIKFSFTRTSYWELRHWKHTASGRSCRKSNDVNFVCAVVVLNHVLFFCFHPVGTFTKEIGSSKMFKKSYVIKFSQPPLNQVFKMQLCICFVSSMQILNIYSSQKQPKGRFTN